MKVAVMGGGNGSHTIAAVLAVKRSVGQHV